MAEPQSGAAAMALDAAWEMLRAAEAMLAVGAVSAADVGADRLAADAQTIERAVHLEAEAVHEALVRSWT